MGLIFNPVVHGLLIYAVAALLFTISDRASLLVAFAAGIVYAIGSPVLIALRPRWWLNALFSVVVFIFLVGGLPATAAAIGHRQLGDDLMVMLTPFMLFPVMLLGSLVFWLIRRRRARIA